jgi:hypothetical protein
MIEGLNAVSANGLEMLPAEMKSWLKRALQLEAERSFATALEARAAFDEAVSVDETRARQVLTGFLAECQTFGRASAPAAAPTDAPAATVPVSEPAAAPRSTPSRRMIPRRKRQRCPRGF